MSEVTLRTPRARGTQPARSARSANRHDGVFAGYGDLGGYARAFDEMFDAQGNVRAPYKGIYSELAPSDASELEARAEALGRAFVDQGITFSLSGQERPFPLDLVPRVISAADWSRLERGIIQRVKALELYLDDIYGEQEILRDGVIPRRLVTSCEHFHREAFGIVPPNGVRIHVAGIDLVRDAKGDFRVLEDNLRSPSGVSYVMENRRTMARVVPNLFATHRVRAVGDYASHLLRALRNAAANNVADPTVVVLTPGVYNSAYFEHSLLARQMGVELVEGRDLFCRDNAVYMRTTEGERQVDVIYRRIDDAFLDPMQFRPDSVLGVAGLLNAARAGNVVISSAVGNGVGDDKLVYVRSDDHRVLPRREAAAGQRRHPALLARRRTRGGARPHRRARHQTGGRLRRLRHRVRPRRVGERTRCDRQEDPQRPARLGRPAGRAAVDGAYPDRRPVGAAPCRPAAVRGQRRRRRMGAAGRAHARRAAGGSLVVNSSQGGGSKDTWVLASRTSAADRELGAAEVVRSLPRSSLGAKPDHIDGQSQDQQQQQQ